MDIIRLNWRQSFVIKDSLCRPLAKSAFPELESEKVENCCKLIEIFCCYQIWISSFLCTSAWLTSAMSFETNHLKLANIMCRLHAIFNLMLCCVLGIELNVDEIHLSKKGILSGNHLLLLFLFSTTCCLLQA